MKPLVLQGKLRLDYTALDDLGYWRGCDLASFQPDPEPEIYPIQRAYVRVLRIADWDHARPIRIGQVKGAALSANPHN